MERKIERGVEVHPICLHCQGSGGIKGGCKKCDGRGWVNTFETVQKTVTGVSVREFAAELRKSPETLLEQLNMAGCKKEAWDDEVTDQDKHLLLKYLQGSRNTTRL